MRLVFGESTKRTTAALRAAALLGLSIAGVSDIDGIEHVAVRLDPAPPPRVIRPVAVFAVYARREPLPDETPEQFMADPATVVGEATVPPAGDELTIVMPELAPETEFHVQIVIGYPD